MRQPLQNLYTDKENKKTKCDGNRCVEVISYKIFIKLIIGDNACWRNK